MGETIVKRNLFLVLLLGLILTVAAACGSSDNNVEAEDNTANNAGNSNDDHGDQDVYTVATDNSYAPFEFINEETDELEGFDVDLIKALADEAGIEIEIAQLEFDGIVAGLGSGTFDIGIAGMTIPEEREENIDFTQHYYEDGLILAVTDEHDDIEYIDDVDDKVIATRVGSTSEDYLEENTEAEREAFPEITDAYPAVMQNKVDAVLY